MSFLDDVAPSPSEQAAKVANFTGLS